LFIYTGVALNVGGIEVGEYILPLRIMTYLCIILTNDIGLTKKKYVELKL